MAVNLSPIGGVAAQFFDNSGNVLSGGKIFTYAAGTTTPQATYTSSSGATPLANPIILDAAGRVPTGEIWLTDGSQYKFIIKTSTDVQIGSYDNIVGINSNFVNYTNSQEFQTATAGQTVFTLTTMAYQPGTNSLSVFVDGVNQYGPGALYAYQETSSTVVTFTSGLHVGADVKFTTSAINASAAGDAEQVSYVPPFTGSVATNVEAKLAQTVSVKDFGAIGNGVTNDASAFQKALEVGASNVYVPTGTYAISSNVNATLISDVVLYGPGKIQYTGATNNVLPFLAVETAGFSFSVDGLSFNGDNKVSTGLRVYNTAAVVLDTLPNCTINNCTFYNFRMNVAGIWNQAVYIAGSFQLVNISNNRVRNITRAAGTGSPGSSGTSGIEVVNYDATRFIRECLHYGNSYSNITGDDLVGSANNVDYDGFKFFAPNPSTNSGQYVQSTVNSYGNTYRNCRGRALKIQALGNVNNETVVRDADYTIFGGSVEINFQYGVGSVTNCQFIYTPYGGVSPIQTSLSLVSFYQGTDYTENTGSAVVNGIQVFNSITSGGDISYIVLAGVGTGVAVPAKPLVSVSNVSVNAQAVNAIASIGYDAGTYGTLRLDNIVVPKLNNCAVTTSGTDTNFDIVATNVVNIDGVTTPANAKPFVLTGTFTPVVFGGGLIGSMNQGFLNAYAVSSSTNKGPTIAGGALSDPLARAGGAVSVQSLALVDDASSSFESRFYTISRGLFCVSANYDYTTQGVFATGSNQIYTIAAQASNLFEVSTTGLNPDVDGKINLWYNTGVLNIKNRLGGSYVFTVTFIG